MDEKAPWRELSRKEREDIADDIRAAAINKFETGAAEYGDQFQGDPLDHLEGELLDGLFYVAMARRERNWYRHSGGRYG